MKHILLAVILWMSLSDVYAQTGFKVSGRAAGMPDGTVWMFARVNANRLDTLGQASLKNGVFEFTGRVERGCLALIAMTDGETGLQFMLENADYTVELNEQREVKIEGGRAQSLFREFDEINKSMSKKREEVQVAQQSLTSREQARALQNSYNSFIKKAVDKQLELIKTNGDCFVSAYILAGMMQNAPLEMLKEAYGNFSEEVKTGYYGSLVGKQIAHLEQIAVGAVAPNFTVLTPGDDTLSLHSIQGKVKFVDFWASWCAPCRKENPNLVELYGKYRAKGFEIFSVSLDTDKAVWEKAIADDGMTWAQGSELLQVPRVAILYSIKSIPHTLLLDENNRILAKDLRGKELKKKLEELFGK